MKNSVRLLRTLLPFIVFLIIIIFLWQGLFHDPHQIPSPFIGKPVPDFKATTLMNPKASISNKDLKGKPILLNVFATWCLSCRAEHSVLMEARQSSTFKIVGLNYKDNRKKAIQWLNRLGNPFDEIIFDPTGNIAINFGVYGTPETFIIDRKGIVRYKYIGPISPDDMQTIILPIIKKLQG